MGRRQVVRLQILILAFVGSIPTAPTILVSYVISGNSFFGYKPQ
jgi:hypothetical protein